MCSSQFSDSSSCQRHYYGIPPFNIGLADAGLSGQCLAFSSRSASTFHLPRDGAEREGANQNREKTSNRYRNFIAAHRPAMR